jgi:hypothetical protein
MEPFTVMESSILMQMEILIEDGVPVTPAKLGSPPLYRWPFEKMQVGQSFALPEEHATAIRSAVSRYAARTQTKFVTRIENGTIRCWRTK